MNRDRKGSRLMPSTDLRQIAERMLKGQPDPTVAMAPPGDSPSKAVTDERKAKRPLREAGSLAHRSTSDLTSMPPITGLTGTNVLVTAGGNVAMPRGSPAKR